ncbi:MAG TPA: lipoyl(octanoyl) transferase LipB [Steroidobacteraceae bacterium]
MNAAVDAARLAGSAVAATLRPAPIIRHLGRVDYDSTWHRMQRLTDERSAASPDEIWFLEHAPIFTLGMSARPAHLIAPGDIPVLQIDRGGQVTYHGPGQLVVYPLIDLKRAGLSVRDLVSALENAVIAHAAEFGIHAQTRPKAPGVYVGARKLASVGIRIRRGSSYHGLALNVQMDLEPFTRIDPCGYPGLQMTQLADLGGPDTVTVAAQGLEPHLLRALFTRG